MNRLADSVSAAAVRRPGKCRYQQAASVLGANSCCVQEVHRNGIAAVSEEVTCIIRNCIFYATSNSPCPDVAPTEWTFNAMQETVPGPDSAAA